MDTDSHTELGLIVKFVTVRICSVHSESVLPHIRGGSIRSDSMIDGRLKLVFVKEIWSDQ
jgi:hypothetical protein